MAEEDDKTLKVPALEDEPMDSALSRMVTRPSLNAAISIKGLGRLGEAGQVSVNGLIDELSGQIKAVNKGDMSRPEALLMAQAHTLDALFGRLMDSALANMGEYIEATEKYMRLALKAQSQSAQTIRVLNELKNPKKVAFIQQANVANGHQQVNNPLRTEELENQPNELLEREEHERMDFGAASASGRADKDMETVGTIHGAKE